MMIFKLFVYAAMVGSLAVILLDMLRLLKWNDDEKE